MSPSASVAAASAAPTAVPPPEFSATLRDAERLTNTGLESSSVIVPVASKDDSPPDKDAFDTDDNVSFTVSLTSSASSPATVTDTVLAVSPTENVNVPLAAV